MAQIKKRDNTIYALAAFGAVTVFLGHGLWAIDGKESFAKLLSGSFENILGVTINPDSAVSYVKFISVDDPYLIAGQVLFSLTVATYLFMIIKYRKPDPQVAGKR